MSAVFIDNIKVENLKEDKEYFDFGAQKIEVSKYLPIYDKISAIDIILQKSEDYDGIFSPCKLYMYFKLYTVLMYSNIIIDNKDEGDIFNFLEKIGLADEVIKRIDEKEYNLFTQLFKQTLEFKQKNRGAFYSILHEFTSNLPKNAEAMKDIIDNFDKEKYQEVINFAKQANLGKPV